MSELVTVWRGFAQEARDAQIRWSAEVERRIQDAGGDEKDKAKQGLILDAKHMVSRFIAERQHWEGYIVRAKAETTPDPRQPVEREPGEDDDAW